ncbi:MAG: magnesium transporter [Proteobacteria bacterium]|nr:magnesium transporter [Pseudomonadota bacterium]
MSAEIVRHHISFDDLWELWPSLANDERSEWFGQLERDDAEEFFSSVTCEDQAELLAHLPPKEQRFWMRTLAPDDAADVLQMVESDSLRSALKEALTERVRKEVTALMAYREDEAGGLMSPRFARIRPDMTVDESIAYLRKQTNEELETIYYVYVLDSTQHLLGVVSLKELFKARGNARIAELMETDLTTIHEGMNQEQVAIYFAREDYFALPVVDDDIVMKGIITIDDIVDVVTDEATEDIQKLGGMAALDDSYLQSPLRELYNKRVVWLMILFAGTIITTRMMSAYADAMETAIILGVFVPMIMSSGGNTGSQAATLITRAMALGEVRMRDVLKVLGRELVVGSKLGLTVGGLGFGVVTAYHFLGLTPDEPGIYLPLAFSISLSIFSVMLFGSILGSMLPFLLRAIRLDPAAASAPLVATMIDASGIFIYFTIAMNLLRGLLL